MIKQQDSDNALKQIMTKQQDSDNALKKLMLEQQNAISGIDEKVREMSVVLSGKVEKLEELIENVDHKLEGKIENVNQDLKKNTIEMDQKILQLERKITDIACNGLTTPIIQTIPGIKLKPPTFDGTTSFNTFKFQFETALKQNKWNDEDRVAALIVALKGEAAEAIQTIREHDRYNYMEVMKALDRKYGSDHKREMYRMELKERYQKGGETLQEFATAVERLVHFAHANTSTEYMERIKIDALVKRPL